jgi:hypothetical protein
VNVTSEIALHYTYEDIMARDWRDYGRRLVNGYPPVFDRVANRLIGRIVNISVSGAMLVSEEPIEIPSVFACSMELPERLCGSGSLEFDIQAKWCKRNDTTGLYETGYQFVNLTHESMKSIQVILERATSTEIELGNPRVFKAPL